MQAGADRAAYEVRTPQGSIFVKHYKPSGLRGRLRDFVLRRKPQRAFAYGRLLRGRGVSTPEPLGLFVSGRCFPREALLATRWLGTSTPWSRRLSGGGDRPPARSGVRRELCGLARLLGQLHGAGFYHGDLAGNLFFAGAKDREEPYLVDLEDVRRLLTRRRRVKNLEELGRGVLDLEAVSLSDRWVFLRAYAEAAGLGVDEARRLWREARAAQLWRIRRASGNGS